MTSINLMRGSIVEKYLAVGLFDTFFGRNGKTWSGLKNHEQGKLGLSLNE